MSFIRCFCGNTNAHATVVHVNFKGPILCPIFSFQTPVMDEWTNHFSDLQPKCKSARLQLPVQNEGWAWKRGHTQSSRVAAPEGTVDTWLPANHHAVSETQVLPPVSLSEQLAVWQTAAVKGSQGVCAGARSLPTKSTSPNQKTTCRHGGCTAHTLLRWRPIGLLTSVIPHLWEEEGALNSETQMLLCG